MARVTVEDCIDKVDSPYELVLVAKERATQLNSGIEPSVDRDNDKNTVIALREIADETISADEFKQSLVEEYQTVSPINDEDDLALEFTDENIDNLDEEEGATDELKENHLESETPEKLEDIKESIMETNDNEKSNTVSETQTDQSN